MPESMLMGIAFRDFKNKTRLIVLTQYPDGETMLVHDIPRSVESDLAAYIPPMEPGSVSVLTPDALSNILDIV